MHDQQTHMNGNQLVFNESLESEASGIREMVSSANPLSNLSKVNHASQHGP